MEIDDLVDNKRYRVVAEGVYNEAGDHILSSSGKKILGPMRSMYYFPQDAESLGIVSVNRIEDPLPTEPGSIIEDAVGDVLKLDEDGWNFGYSIVDENEIQRPFTVLRIGEKNG